MCWMLLLVPGATAIDLGQPKVLLPACCRVHGAHHCMGTAHQESGPVWRGAGCPFASLTHAAIVLVPYLPSTGRGLARSVRTAHTPSAEHAALSAFLAGLPGSRAPPSLV